MSIGDEALRLRAIERGDIQQYYEWVNDPEVTRYLSLYLPFSTGDEEKWFDKQQERDPHERPMAIEINTADNWKLIGNCGLFNIDWVARSAELGIMIGEKALWDQGHGTKVMKLLLRHGFETLNLNRLFLYVDAENLRGRRAYQKAGFAEEGRMREAVYKCGKFTDLYIMSVLRSEWDERNMED